MKALRCDELGPPSTLALTELPDLTPGDGQVVIDVHAAGVNFPDGLVVAGKYQTKREPPFVPGSEVAGTIRAVGAGVTDLTPGMRVAAFCAIGGYAEQVVAPAAQVHPLPDGVDFRTATVFPVAYGTSYHALVDRARLAQGESLLVLGASGGVGLAAVEIGKALGARVIAAASTPERLALCREHGADELIDYRAEDLGARLRELTGAGVDVVYDPVGGAQAETAVRRLAWGGRYLTVGYASGDIPKVGMNRLLLNESELLGVLWGVWAGRDPGRNAANLRTLFSWYEAGLLRPHLHGTWPLANGAAALEAVLSRGTTGKVVIDVREDA